MKTIRTRRWSRYLTASWLAAAILLACQTSAHVGHVHGGHDDGHDAETAHVHGHAGLVMDALHGHESQLAAPCLLCRLGGGIAPAPALAAVWLPTAVAAVAEMPATDVFSDSPLLGSCGPRGPPLRV